MFYFKQIKDGKIVSVESKSVDIASPDFIRATKAEYDNFLASLSSTIPEPVRDLAVEIDDLKLRVKNLEKK